MRFFLFPISFFLSVVAHGANVNSRLVASTPLLISGSTISLPAADASHNGYLTFGAYSTFLAKQGALTLGNLTSVTSGVSISGGANAIVGPGAAINIQTASTSQPGILSASDFVLFAAKAPLANPAFTGVASLASVTISGSLKSINCHLEPSEQDLGVSGTSKAIDLSSNNVFTTTLTGNLTATLSNPQAGCPYAFVFTQDATGGRTLIISGVTTVWGGGVSALSTAANSVDKVTCVYNGNISKLMCDLGKAYQ